jgi:hypothetical protein
MLEKKHNCICEQCKTSFYKNKNEITRSNKNNRKHFCSRRCVGLHNAKNLLNIENPYPIKLHANNRRTEYTKFKYHLRNISKRDKEINITIEDLKEQWELQKGICVFTGINLIISSYSNINKNPIYSASVDRIDNNKGYVKGNIRWVSRAINFMKNAMTDDMVWELINIIKNPT